MQTVGSRVRTSVVPMARAMGPLDFFREVRGTGAILMESAALGRPVGTRSLVVPEGVIRLRLRGPRATYVALDAAGERLLDVLGRPERGTLHRDFPARAGDPAASDEERLRTPSVLDAVRELAGLVVDEDSGLATPAGVYGGFSYELVDRWEQLPQRAPDPWNEPDVNVVLALDTVLFDHLRSEVRIVTRAITPEQRDAAEARHRRYETALRRRRGVHASPSRAPIETAEKAAVADVSDESFLASVSQFLDHIARGDIFQGVLSRGLTMTSRAHPLDVYGVLRAMNPSPYMFSIDLGDGTLLGASPETCLKVTGRTIEIRPIAGTAPRGLAADGTIDLELDSRLAVGLLLDRKEQAEHAMLVDLARNDVARVSVAGTRCVAEPFAIEKYSHVQHLVSGVTGELRPELDALHAYRAAANMGTLTGAPKLRAMELIRETEPFARGFYGGAVGYLLQDGTFDSCIVIRSLRFGSGRYSTRTGAGIVADSLPERELAETEHKARAVRQAVAIAEASACP